MIRNLFSIRRPSAKSAEDDFDRVISKIERFAPKQHRVERDSHYYNYRTLNPYVNPLLALLTEISNHNRLNDDTILLRGLFEKLKAFYDPKDRLSLTEASQDPGLRRNFVDMLSYFYGEKANSRDILKRFFGDMRSGGASVAKVLNKEGQGIKTEDQRHVKTQENRAAAGNRAQATAAEKDQKT